MKILTVDTNIEQLNALVSALGPAYPKDEIVPFANPMSAVKYGINHSIGAVFTEIDMRGVDGFTLVKLMRQHNQSLKVYFVTATEAYMDEAERQQADGYLLKPVAPSQLPGDCCL